MRRLLPAAALIGALWAGAAAAGDPPPNAMMLLNPANLEAVGLANITVCNGDTQWTPPVTMVPEVTALSAATGVKRSGNLLRVGRARFRNIPFNDDQTRGLAYTFAGRFAAAPVALVRVIRSAGDAWILVDPKTGANQDVAAFPMPGPDGHTFVSAALENDYDATGIEIVEWRNGRFIETRLEARFPCGLAWDGPDAVSLWLKTGPGNDPAVDWKPARLVRKDGVWTIEGP